ncbi:MAG TPA: hypothetical protein VEH29_04700 [Acidimicrobiales bacterium]|nr:hypothetical protein [Acidimicrobiales bacterium]
MVAGLLMSAALGAAVTTRAVPAPIRHVHPTQPIVVTRVTRLGGSGQMQALSGPRWI